MVARSMRVPSGLVMSMSVVGKLCRVNAPGCWLPNEYNSCACEYFSRMCRFLSPRSGTQKCHVMYTSIMCTRREHASVNNMQAHTVCSHKW